MIKSCADCASKKTPKNHSRAPLLPIPVDGPFDRVSVDCLGPFPPSHSNNRYIVVFTDYLTRWPEAFAVPNTEAKTIAELLVDHIFARHGAPRTLLSDRGANFLSSLVQAVCDIIRTEKLNTTAYHPMTNSVVERFNGSLAQSLSMHVDNKQKDWDTFIPLVLFAYRVSVHPTTGETPFFMLYGCEPRLPLDIGLTPPGNLSPSVAEHRAKIVSNLQRAYQIARENTQRAQQAQLSKKLLHLWHGPFRIVQKLSPVHYRLLNQCNKPISTTVHANRMKLFYDREDRPIGQPLQDVEEDYLAEDDLPLDSFETDHNATVANAEHDNQAVPHEKEAKPDVRVAPHEFKAELGAEHRDDETDLDDSFIIDNESVFRVENILATRLRGGKRQYLVNWEGYPSTENTWEPEDNILDSQLIDNFYARQGHTGFISIAAYSICSRFSRVACELSSFCYW